MPWVQSALDSIEFISGPPDSPWGSVRAAMGHPEPWALNYMAIGNEVGGGWSACKQCGLGGGREPGWRTGGAVLAARRSRFMLWSQAGNVGLRLEVLLPPKQEKGSGSGAELAD